MASATATKPMELEGSLKAFKFPEILQFLGMGRMTGVLSLEQEKRSVKLHFNEGKITSVASSDRYLRLGQMLVYAGRLSRRALDEAIEFQERSASGKLLGQILVEKQLVQPDDLKAAVRLQIEEEVWELFRWDDGNFRFEQGSRGATGGGDVALDVEPLLLEGSRRMDEWQAICANIDDPTEVYRVNPELKGPPEGKLDASTWRVLSLVDGKLSVDAIVRLSNLGRFETYWALAQLLRADLIVSNVGYSDSDEPAAPELKISPRGISTAATQILSEPLSMPAGGEKQGLLGTLLGRLKSSPASEADEADAIPDYPTPMATGDFLTDVGLVCAALNHAIDCLEADPKFFCDAQTPDAVKSLWFEATQRYPKCDLVRLRGRRLHPENYERYIKTEGSLSRALGGAHDDSIEGLKHFWQALAERCRSRGEDPTATQTLSRAMRPYAKASARVQAPGFSLAEWMKEQN